MTSVRQVWRAGRIAVLTTAAWVTIYGAASAQPSAAKSQPTESVGGGTYVMAYGLVILAITLGMLFVCASSKRRERARPEQFASSKLVKGDDDDDE
jgi:hypothetical protein